MGKVAIIGAGNLGTAIAIGIANAKLYEPRDIVVSRRAVEKLDDLKRRGMRVTGDNAEAVRSADVIMLCVQPKQVAEILSGLRGELVEGRHILVSTVTGVSTAEIRDGLGGKRLPIVRVMPNTAISVGASMTCVCSLGASEADLKTVVAIFDRLGKTMIMEEGLMKAATVLAASNIAFFMRVMRAMTQGGIQLGFHSEDAREIAMQVAKGAALLLDANRSHPEAEIDRVTTPQGCTIEGLNEMEHQGLSSAIIKGLVASYDKIAKIKC